MKNINEISLLELSKYINSLRRMLLKEGFFEHHLYLTTNYKIESTETFKIEDKLFLRYNPEPEIWAVGEVYDKFFWINSLFRNEKKLTSIHKKEFTVIDMYLKEKDREQMISFFVKVLENIEEELNLPKLSTLPLEYIKYRDFKKEKLNKHNKYWLIVTDYPIEESFYDELNNLQNETKKFEIYFVNNGDVIELAVGGNLGENLNKKKFIKEDKFVNKKVISRKFIGFGFGIERLIYIYENIR